jgi:negative regulator of flagellin synthesis FlgM
MIDAVCRSEPAATLSPGTFMSTINSIGVNQPVQRIFNNPISTSLPSDTAAPAGGDVVDISNESDPFSGVQNNGIRTDLVANIRSQIDAGTYETDDKLNTASDRLLDDITQ